MRVCCLCRHCDPSSHRIGKSSIANLIKCQYPNQERPSQPTHTSLQTVHQHYMYICSQSAPRCLVRLSSYVHPANLSGNQLNCKTHTRAPVSMPPAVQLSLNTPTPTFMNPFHQTAMRGAVPTVTTTCAKPPDIPNMCNRVHGPRIQIISVCLQFAVALPVQTYALVGCTPEETGVQRLPITARPSPCIVQRQIQSIEVMATSLAVHTHQALPTLFEASRKACISYPYKQLSRQRHTGCAILMAPAVTSCQVELQLLNPPPSLQPPSPSL